MILKLPTVVDNPHLVTYSITLDNGTETTLRPLESNDVDKLSNFLDGLSKETTRLIIAPDSKLPSAKELCDAINKYDKLRFVLETSSNSNSSKVIGLIEYSFGIPERDIERFTAAGYKLNEKTDCRFGPTLADEYQGQGVGDRLFPYVIKIAKKFGKNRIILWGGVLMDNKRAVRYYTKHGFETVGEFSDSGDRMLDMILDISND